MLSPAIHRGSGSPLYELGCISAQACKTTPAMVGKRAAGLHFKCVACCNDTALCNQMSDCGNLVPPTAHSHRTILPTMPAFLPRDCGELHLTNGRNGSYTIFPYGVSNVSTSVYCEFDSDGTWTVIQRRYNGSVDFYRNWTDYKKGFGSANGEYWLGNDIIHQLTSTHHYTLKILLTDWFNNKTYAEYRVFYIDNESHNYTLTIGGFSGTARDNMNYHNGNQFSTRDRDNDKYKEGDCMDACGLGTWWHDDCCESSLNGIYMRNYHVERARIYWWGSTNDARYNLMLATTMMIRRNEN